MTNLILTVLFTSWLLIAFRLFSFFNINQLQAIIFNYITCALIGLFFSNNYFLLNELKTIETWMYMALLTGACFLPTFYLMSVTVKRISITISTIAGKISLIIPVTVSLLYLNQTNSFSTLNGIGLALGLGAILLSSIRTSAKLDSGNTKSKMDYFLPLLVFLGGGLVDVLINITNYVYLPSEKSTLFPFFAFSTAAAIGLIVLVYRIFFEQEKLTLQNGIAGIVLGVPNYLSIYFLLETLKEFNNNGAIVFPLLNILVILFSALVAIIFFKEKLNRYNYLGLLLALVALGMLLSF